jgi:hypothetical protein
MSNYIRSIRLSQDRLSGGITDGEYGLEWNGGKTGRYRFVQKK